jgi:hypothetical protein
MRHNLYRVFGRGCTRARAVSIMPIFEYSCEDCGMKFETQLPVMRARPFASGILDVLRPIGRSERGSACRRLRGEHVRHRILRWWHVRDELGGKLSCR